MLSKLLGRTALPEALPLTARYPYPMLRTELIKSGLGCAGTVTLVTTLQPSPWIGWPLALVALLFGLYFLQLFRRLPLRYRLDDQGLSINPERGGQMLLWSELENMRLHFYPNTRKASLGTLNLALYWAGKRYKVDSNLDHFPSLLLAASKAVREKGIEIHPTTAENMVKLEL